MYIIYRKKKVKRLTEKRSLATKKYGDDVANKLMQRMNEIKQAESVGALKRNMPASNPHFLKGKRKKDLSIVIKGKWRIITRPDMDEDEYIINGNTNMNKITKIEIIKIEDYHD
ncbi:MAG: type II toxin-antitoxin system RelE/ParE family toxin [candidate division WOR-3 bacterium]|nr:type II toxin-antitoxin system RelE/ParE family toxin [candidate division WOR-3 bacterium]